MPRFDKTGPMGQGPQTGGGFGLCSGNGSGSDEPAWGGRNRGDGRRRKGLGQGGLPRGGGRGRCFGGGRGRGFPNSQLESRPFDNNVNRANLDLEELAARLLKENKELRARLSELEAKEE